MEFRLFLLSYSIAACEYTWRTMGPLCEKKRSPQNRKYIYHNAARRGPSHGHRQHAQKFGEVRQCGFWVMRADIQTDRQTDLLITILRTLTGAK